MELESAQVRIRHARHEDYESVMDMDRTLKNGLDYLDTLYHHYIRDASTCCFIAERNGQVSYFVAFHILDDGKRAVGISARTRTELRNKGLNREVHLMIGNALCQERPSIKTISAVTGYVNYYEKMATDPNSGITIKKRTECLLYYLNLPEDLYPVSRLTDNLFNSIQALHKVDIQRLSENKGMMQKLFGGNSYIETSVNWLPFAVGKFALEQIERDGIITAAINEGDGSYEAIVFSHDMKAPSGLNFHIYLYSVTDNNETIVNHILYHIRHSARIAPASGIARISIGLPLSLDGMKAKELMKPYLGDSNSQYSVLTVDDCRLSKL